MVACFLAYANAIQGDFVYDDVRQVRDNHLIQDSRHYATALTSDVMAFKGGSDEAWSNYWRPTFTAWSIINFRLFGLENTAGWHIGNILLHAIATLLIFGFLQYLGLGRTASAVISLIFAVHPVHVESVAWIAGSPDILMSIGFIGALWLALRACRGSGTRDHVLAIGLLMFALGAKEVAIMFPFVLFAVLALSPRDEAESRQDRAVRALQDALPYFLVAVGYFLIRYIVLGEVSKDDSNDVSLLGVALTAPELLTFYLRQSFAPLWLGPSYPVRADTLAVLGKGVFWFQVGVVVAAALVLFHALKKDQVRRTGALIFAFALLPAFNIDAFIPEHIVHDRYLYLPLLGLLMVVVPALASAGSAMLPGGARARTAAGMALAGVVTVFLAFQTVQYNRVWLTDLALWERGVAIDPGSSFNWSQYAHALAAAGREAEAQSALQRSLGDMTASSTPDALIKRAELALKAGRPEDAVEDLNTVLRGQPGNVVAYEKLAQIYQQAGQLEQAAKILMTGRERVPRQDCQFSSNLAVLYYLAGAPNRALAELERVRGEAVESFSPGCRLALFRLGQLYIEIGRGPEGQSALSEYLDATRNASDEISLRYRAIAQDLLAR